MAPDPARIPADGAIFPTIVVILSNFFLVHQRIILYTCDDLACRITHVPKSVFG
ncbi:MAG: hypothetical protein H7Y12_07900 [Sphingobacteriaceae bacterium]|nr:hypothetical protein [Cytophagaceae bacterium]